MKKILRVLMLIATFFSFNCYASDNSGVYVLAGGGTFNFPKIEISGPESDLLLTTGVTGKWEADKTTRFAEFGIGYRFGHFSVEGTYLDGMHVHTSTTVTNVDAGNLTIANNIFPLGNYPTSIVLDRDARATMAQVVVNGEYPLTSWASAMGTLGAGFWRAEVVDTISFDNSGVKLYYKETDHGVAPIMRLGFNFKMSKETSISVQTLVGFNSVNQYSVDLRHFW